MTHDDLIHQQIAYYKARAPEYDDWFYRRGRYDHGPAANQQWHAEAAQLRARLHSLGRFPQALELAGGTGIWTQELLQISDQLTVLDAAAETLAIAKTKLPPDAALRFQIADLFAWEPVQHYDLVFFAFWLSHVPPEKLAPFLARVSRALKPGGTLFLVDSRPAPDSSAKDHQRPDPAGTSHERKLNDGRSFTIVKVFYDPADLTAKLAAQGIQAQVQVTANYFLWGEGQKNAETVHP